MRKEHSQSHRAMLKSFEMPDERSFGVFKMLNDVYPAFAKQLFQNNALMERLVMSGHNPMDILDYPICGKCETLAPYSGYVIRNNKYIQKCTCVADKCGATTVNPITLRDWIKYEMKKRVSEDFYEAIEVAIDQIAFTMLQKYQSMISMEKQKENKQIIMSDGTLYSIGGLKPNITHLHDEIPKMPKNAVIIPDNIGEE